MRVLTPSGRFESRPTPTVAAEQKAIKAVQDAVAEFPGRASKSFLTGNAALAGGGMTPAAQPTSWNNTGNAMLNALQARISQNLNSSFQKVSPELEQQLQQQGLSWGPPFPPGRPLNPFWGIRGPARTWDFAVGENVQLTPRWNRISFQTLKALYDKYDVAQICVRHLIDDVRSLEVNWLPPKNCKDDVDEDIQAAEKFWAYPDRRQPFDCWLAEWLQDVLRYDAGALFLRETEAGDPYAVEIISGETIIPLIDYFGRRPADEEPDEDGEIEGHVTPAFLQIIKGMPWDWLTSDQMIYQPLWPLPESQYGQCPLESILLSANTDLRFQWHFLQYFTEGTLPAGFMEAPPDLSDPAQIQAWQDHWDGLMLGDQAKLNQIRWVPAGAKFTGIKDGAFDETFPLYLMRRTCAAYKVTPTDLGFTETVNRASSEIQVDVQARVGRGPLIQYVEGVVNLITSQRLKLRARLQIDPGGEIEDRVAVAQAHSIYIEKGVESPDEVRAELGKPIDKSRPVTRFIDNSRAGPIPLIAIESQAGEIDPETYGRAESQQLVSTPYSSPPGAIPPQGSPEQKAAGEHTAQAARDLITATTGQAPADAVAESEAAGANNAGEAPPTSPAFSRETPDAVVKAVGWRNVLALLDEMEKGQFIKAIEQVRRGAAKCYSPTFDDELVETPLGPKYVQMVYDLSAYGDDCLKSVVAVSDEEGGPPEYLYGSDCIAPIEGPFVETAPNTFESVGKAEAEKAAAQVGSGSGMVSLDLPDGTIDPVPGGEQDHHITVVFLGSEVDDATFGAVCTLAQAVASKLPAPTGTVGGLGSFPPSEASDGKTPVFAVPDVSGLDALRAAFEPFNESEHADYKPHVTLAYVDKGEDWPDPVPPTPVTFPMLSVHRGDECKGFPFGGGAAKAGASAGITAATGIEGKDFQGSEDDDEDEDKAKKAALVALEMRRWRENARNRLKKGRAPRPFASTVLTSAEHDAVWCELQKAQSREEVDAAFAALGRPAAGERPAFHSQADRIVEHYSDAVKKALQSLYSRQQIEDAVRAAQEAKAEPHPAEKAACWDKSEHECSLRELAYRDRLLSTDASKWTEAWTKAQLDLAYLAARKALESGSANTSDLATALEALYGDSFLQGAYDAALASGSTVVASLRDIAAAPAATYWTDWKPGYGQAAAQAADGGMRDLLNEAGITIKGLTDSATERVGNAIAQGLAEGQSVPRVAQLAADAGATPARAEMIANTEMNRASTAAAVETYVSAEVGQVEWLAEADACPECEANADGSPYPLGEAPTPPQHPNCRCALAPA